MHEVDAKGILSSKNGMNLYRGCTHGCIYCDSRSACYQITHAFEDVEIKRNAPELLEAALRKKRKKCMIGTGAMSDPYLPIEEHYELTRRCLGIIEAHGFGLSILTKSARILRDLDLLVAIHKRSKCVVQMTLTTLDDALCRVLEPNVSSTSERIAALQVFREQGIPTIVWLCPILPFINDTPENIQGILEACGQAGVKGVLCFGMGLTLREGNREYFYRQLDVHFPGLKARYQKTYGNKYMLESPKNAALMRLAREICQNYGMIWGVQENFSYLNEYEEKPRFEQLHFFE